MPDDTDQKYTIDWVARHVSAVYKIISIIQKDDYNAKKDVDEPLRIFYRALYHDTVNGSAKNKKSSYFHFY